MVKELLGQFYAQREYQSRPIERALRLSRFYLFIQPFTFQAGQSKNKAARAVERLIENEATELSLSSTLGSLQTELADAIQDGQSVATIQSKIDDTSAALERVRKSCAQMKRELSLHGDGSIAKYNQIRKDGFILMWMNLRVLL